MAKLVVISHKPCWLSTHSPSGYASDGGFPLQMQALAELFDETSLLVPCAGPANRPGELALTGRQLTVVPLSTPRGNGLGRKLALFGWLLGNGPTLLREVWRADAVHAPIPGDLGTLGLVLAFVLRKPLYVRYCGNWLLQETLAERFCRWFMETFAGGQNVCLATGGLPEPPSVHNRAIRWIFATTLHKQELELCAQQRQNRPQQPPRLVIACRQEKEKGTGVVLESLPLLRRDFPGLMLDVIGDGAALPQFKQQAAALGLADAVIFHGQVSHERVIQILQQADLFCFPTVSSEGFPKAVLEALACGLPVITTKVSVLPLLIGNRSGVLLDEASPLALAEAVRKCLADPARYRAMSELALATARQYSLEAWRETIGGWLREAWGPLRATS